MHLTPEERAIGIENFYAAIGSDVKGPDDQPSRRAFLQERIKEGHLAGEVPGHAYFGYEAKLSSPVRVGVIGTGDEGSVLIGAINTNYVEVKSIADIRPYNQFRAFHGDLYGEAAQAARPGLMKKYDWKTDEEAREKVKVYGPYRELIAHAKEDGIEAVIIALPLHLHAPAAIAAMRAGLHVLTEKLMGHSVHECKEMARVAKQTGKLLATGHQRHYSILYDNAVDLIRRRTLGDLHYIRAQWHRGNLPGNDSWQQPMPRKAKPDDAQANDLVRKLEAWKKELDSAKGRAAEIWQARVAQLEAQIADEILGEKSDDGKILAEVLGYEPRTLKDAAGKPVYHRPAVEELIRWRLWDRTGGGLMAELGSHQLDAASLFIAAAHGGVKQHPLSVAAAAGRPLFPADRDVDDHIYCLFEFPAQDYRADDAVSAMRRIGVQYASINGNGYGGYGETVLGTKGTLILEREAEVMLFATSATNSKTRVVVERDKKTRKESPALVADESGDEDSAAIGRMALRGAGRGYQQQIEHWAWCIRNPAPENQPRCHPKVAMGDAVIALTTNIVASRGQRIEFKEEWFDPDSDETPEGVKPDLGRYNV